MQRRLTEIFDEGPPTLLPRIRLITDLGQMAWPGVPPAVPPLRRRLELTQLVGGLLDKMPDLAPRSAVYDLADSLAALMDEMQGEGVSPDALRNLDVRDASGHWQRALAFVNLVEAHVGPDADFPDPEARQRRIVEALTARWDTEPPDHPVIVAGSTGSRGTTAHFMRAVARLPQGAVVLPGFDREMPAEVWSGLKDALSGEDHPQFRFARFLDLVAVQPSDVGDWHDAAPPDPARNRLISLALRPAPVTDQWRTEGPRLGEPAVATRNITLMEAPSPRAEAAAIALILRGAAEDGRRAALITPDRMLTRQVTAALDRWGIVPDDSAGHPLPLTAPGRLLRHVAEALGRELTAETLLTLLKHPLTATGAGDRGPHLIATRELELFLRRRGAPYPGPSDLRRFAKERPERAPWVEWVVGSFDGLDRIGVDSLARHVDRHVAVTEALARGPGGGDTGELWRKEAGEAAFRQVEALKREADSGGEMPPDEYAALFNAILQGGEVRETVETYPGIMIWGTLEARVQGADLVIAAGLNEGIWPEAPAPDPWLNRRMRHAVGLLLPERRIGLSAHDFQQAVSAPEVVLSRTVRDAEAVTVPSRWLNRLTNLLGGLSDGGEAALRGMRERGQAWIARAALLDAPQDSQPPARRPSPRPPVDARPKRLSITSVQTLIRDPYAIYARQVLGLNALDPLRQSPDAPLRGTILHRILERFVNEVALTDPEADRAALLGIADEVLAADAPWPAARRLWRAKLSRVADWFLDGERERRGAAVPVGLEAKGELAFPALDLTLRGKLDRVDRGDDGKLTIYDYKTGSVPSPKQIEHFDKQLFLAALMAEAGALSGLPAAPVSTVAHIGLGAKPKISAHALEPGDLERVRAEFERLAGAYRQRSRGYTSRRAVFMRGDAGDYDHLARYGEWDETDPAAPEDVGA
jgi:ATP-dependent helicase/nuclease subunit B